MRSVTRTSGHAASSSFPMSEKSGESRESRGSKASKASKTSKTSKRRDPSLVLGSVVEPTDGVPESSKAAAETRESLPGEDGPRVSSSTGTGVNAASTKPSSGDAGREQRRERSERSRAATPTSSAVSAEARPKKAKALVVSPAVKAALADLAADARAIASIRAAQAETRLIKEAQEMEREVAEAKAGAKAKASEATRKQALQDETQKEADTEPQKHGVPTDQTSEIQRQLAETKLALHSADESRRLCQRDLDIKARAVTERERENDELKRRLLMKHDRDERDAMHAAIDTGEMFNGEDVSNPRPHQAEARPSEPPAKSVSKYKMPSTETRAQGSLSNHEEIFELHRRISNLTAEVQLCEIDKEKLRQLREEAEQRRSDAEAKHANAEVELARSRAAIGRLASLETDLHRVIASKEAGEEKHRAEIRASTSEAESRNAKLTAEVGYYKQQLDKKREKKRLHKQQAFELATKLKQAVDIAKQTARDCEQVIARVHAEGEQQVTTTIREHHVRNEQTAATAAAAAATAAQLAEALEKKRGKKKAYKTQLEQIHAELVHEKNETAKYRAALVNARKLYDSERVGYAATLGRTELQNLAVTETQARRVATLEDALKRAAKDYRRLVQDAKPVHDTVTGLTQTLEKSQKEIARLVGKLSFLEDEGARRKKASDETAVETKELRAKLRTNEIDFAQRLERDRRAWENASSARGEYVEFDPYARGVRDGRPTQGPRGGRVEKSNENAESIDENASLVCKTKPKPFGAGVSLRAAGVSSAHLEKIALREKRAYAQRQKDLGMGERAEYLSSE